MAAAAAEDHQASGGGGGIEERSSLATLSSMLERLYGASDDAEDIEEQTPLLDSSKAASAALGLRGWVFISLATICVRCLQAMPVPPLLYLLKDVHGLGPAFVSSAAASSSLAWALSPSVGLLSDDYPIFGSRRRAYAMLGSLATILGFLRLGQMHLMHSIVQVSLALFVANLGMVMLNVVAQALVVESVREASSERAITNMTYYFVLRQIGSIFGLLISGYLLQQGLHPQETFSRAALLPIAIFLGAFCIPEGKVCALESLGRNLTGSTSVRLLKEVKVLMEFFGTRAVYGPGLMVLFSAALPRTQHAMNYFYSDVLRMSPMAISCIACLQHLWCIKGLLLYSICCQHCRLRTILLSIGCTVAGFTLVPVIMLRRLNVQWGLPDYLFAAFDDGLALAALEVLALPVIALCAQRCPAHLEGTACACMSAAYNLSLCLSGQLGGILTSVGFGLDRGSLGNLWAAKVSTSLLQFLVPVAFVTCLIPEGDIDTIVEIPPQVEGRPGSPGASRLGEGGAPESF
eukprot:TRINITY_DN39656_c0_g1_i1.p1 TRINITY_DN39656_c0_g1~~TRINITY_DN39656_c0_g1_i1.p1  ORF type:complete len:519 (+),score=98.36 TRINITY_DN39656_c0_g1_i1:105-1661(+)